jgi:uncharacterized protein (TIGR03437 family)
VAPYGIAGNQKTSVTVSTNGKQSVPLVMQLASASPAIFTANASGSGQAAALRVAGGSTTITGPDNPVAAGEVLVLYATGLGAMTPTVPDGTVIATPLPVFTASSIKVLIGGQNAEILYAGPAPGLIAGAAQINVRVPGNLTPGQSAVLLVVSDNSSAPGVTVATR